MQQKKHSDDAAGPISRPKLEAELVDFKSQLLNKMLELHYLNNDYGPMDKFQTWLDKAKDESVILQTRDEDLENEDRFSLLMSFTKKSSKNDIAKLLTSIKSFEIHQASPTQATTSTTATQPASPSNNTIKLEQTSNDTTPQVQLTSDVSSTSHNKRLRIEISPLREANDVNSTQDNAVKSATETQAALPKNATPALDPTTTPVLSPRISSRHNSVTATPVPSPSTTQKREREESPTSLNSRDIPCHVDKKLRHDSTKSPSKEAQPSTVPTSLNEFNRSLSKDESIDVIDIDLESTPAKLESDLTNRDSGVIPINESTENLLETSATKSLSPKRVATEKSSTPSQGSQKQVAERAKHEATVTARVAELRKQGLWSQKKLPKCQEPPRPKTHWDYLLEEMSWLSTDFAQERRWKKTAARRCAKMVYKYHQEKQSKKERAEREHLQNMKRLAAAQAKEIRAFWSSVEKVVDFRQQAKIEKTRKQALDQHLNNILVHTGKLSNDIQKSLVVDSKKTSIDDQNESEQDATDDDVDMAEVETTMDIDSISDSDTRGNESRNSVDVATDVNEKNPRDSDYDSSIDDYNNSQSRDSRENIPDREDVISPNDETKQTRDIDDIAAGAESIQPKGNTLETTSVNTKVPYLLKHNLREYQHIGLDWLVAMYNKKLNGILADEMGLGKTIQTISLLAHLACEKEDWGPHLVVVPTSVMLNWEMEFKKWCPAFKILTYYGNPKERKMKRTGWSRPNSFHVCITSYRIVIQDHAAFRRKKWKYFILDEAHYIKNFKSQRWQMLLNFNSERRLLLTGTPLQNDLMELWSLMHFLMPNLFDSCREFKDWFVNPVTGMIEGSNDYNEVIIQRLHKILRPFLLRRLKADVEKQLPQKHEYVKHCRLSKRQRFLYEEFMSLAQTKETLAKGSFFSVINVLMQLRKVCNHPNLFEPRPTTSPFMMSSIKYQIPGLVTTPLDYDCEANVNFSSLNLLLINTALALTTYAKDYIQSAKVTRKQLVELVDNDDFSDSSSIISMSESIVKLEQNGIEIAENEKLDEAYAKFKELNRKMKLKRLESMSKLNDMRCQAESVYYSEMDNILNVNNSDISQVCSKSGDNFNSQSGQVILSKIAQLRSSPILKLNFLSSLLEELTRSPEDIVNELNEIVEKFIFCVPCVSAPAVSLHVSHQPPFKKTQEVFLQQKLHSNLSHRFNFMSKIIVNMKTTFPELRLIEYDCGKLQTLSKLLMELKSQDHRVLIFTQMSRMLDILEQFLNYHGHTYLRLDGATKIDQRQILMERFNNDKKIFCFILSTRSGGIGVNLTGADTVIFYDSDWNPTMDAQAQDRCHRIGQTKDVHIYRLISEDTIERNIFMKAQQKRMLGDLAIEGGNFNTSSFKRQAIQELFNLNNDNEDTDKDVEMNGAATSDDNENVDVSKLEQALLKGEADAGEDLDVDAIKTAKLDVDTDMREFDESIPLNDDSPMAQEKSETELKLETVINSMSKVERYAVTFLESLQKPKNKEELEQTEKELRQQLENQKSLWEQSRIDMIKDESLKNDLGETLLTYPRNAHVYNMVDGEQDVKELPLWAPPTPPTSPPSPVDDASRNNTYTFQAPQAMTPAMAARINAMGGFQLLGFGTDSSATDNRQLIDEKDMYIDYSLHFEYDSSIMLESQLPSVNQQYSDSDLTNYTIGAKRIRLTGTPVVSASYLQAPTPLPHLQKHLQGFASPLPDGSISTSAQPTTRKPKMRRDEVICLPKSLFDKQSPNIARVRRELKLQKLRCVTKGNDTDPFAMQKFFHSFSLNQLGQAVQPDSLISKLKQQLSYNNSVISIYKPEHLPAWTIQEEWAMLVVLQHLQDLPVNLTILTPGHTPNFDFVSDVVHDVGFAYRQYKVCWFHFEEVVQKREMARDANFQQQAAAAQKKHEQQQQQLQQLQQQQGQTSKKSKKQNQMDTPLMPFQPSKTGALLTKDTSYIKALVQRYQGIASLREKRRAFVRSSFKANERPPHNSQVLRVTYNINYDTPLSPTQLAEKKLAHAKARMSSMTAKNLR